jgi:uncharacterized membrane protein YczE
VSGGPDVPRRRRVELADLGPLAQLRAGRLGRRIPQLLVGLWLYGFAMALFIRSGLGLDPWDVFHAGLQRLLGWSLGTIANAVVIGVATDATLAIIPPADGWPTAWALLIGGLVVNGLAGGLYIGSQLGPGPRDGLMTGLARRTGWSLRLVRTGLELTVLGIGWAMGGTVGIGTVVYAVTIGPLVQFFLPLVTVRLHPVGRGGAAAAPDAVPDPCP